MIDITCSACDMTYQVDESKIAQGFRCKICGKVLLVDHQTLGASALQEVVQSTVSKTHKRSRDRWIGAILLVSGAAFLGVSLWIANSRVATPPTSSTTDQSQSIPSEPAPQNPTGELKPIPVPESKELPYLNPKKYRPPDLSQLNIPPPMAHIYPPGELPKLTFPPATVSPDHPVIVTPKCAEGQAPVRLATGERIEPDVGTSGKSKLEITSGLISDAAVRLVDTATNKTSRFVYIRARTVYTIYGIETGTYWLRYSSGLDWIPACLEFTRNSSLNEFPSQISFEEGYETTWKATLHAVPFGNTTTRKIDKKRFLEGDQHFSISP